MPAQDEILLSNTRFSLRFENGFLVSIHPGPGIPGKTDTLYFRPGTSLGVLQLTLAGSESFLMDGSGAEAQVEVSDGKVLKRKEYLAGKSISVTETWRLAGEVLRLEIEIANTGNEETVLEDLALRFPAYSDFSWGCDAASRVIGHHWICGHNSHLLFQRCDGYGPILTVLPQGDTALEYCDTYDAGRGNAAVYMHSAAARRPAEKAGADIHLPATHAVLRPEEARTYRFCFAWAGDTEEVREIKIRSDLMDVQVLPGMTAPMSEKVLLAVRGGWKDWDLLLPEGCRIVSEIPCEGGRITALVFDKVGENTVRLQSADGKKCTLEFFITESPDVMIDKRASFIAGHQHTDPSKWYYGLLAEWNNETALMLGPDEYDRIKGWRIYEVSCDDPGLSKPAFLASKLAERPSVKEAEALDLYVENFVWGGLQCTQDETYPYAIYGIPDWKQLRDSDDPGVRGREHIWRIYDYPHIALMYYKMYRLASEHPEMPLSQTADTYLIRAARTLIAMYTIPLELDDWSAFGTGLYNELVTEDILQALKERGEETLHRRLERLWDRKAYRFTEKNADVFGSEYPFDTTGFESTHALAVHAKKTAKTGPGRKEGDISPERAETFMANQMRCNISCRGVLEMAYWLYGSDYRGDNLHYTLSYMSQMGGWAILDYAVNYARDPFPYLRLGYGSLMSSWALLNAGPEEQGCGWRFPGKEHDGAASGGFEPMYLGETWLQQPHHGGAWYYSCEIDLGFCGYLRGAATVWARDPLFGEVCLGGRCGSMGETLMITPADGVNRRVHLIRCDRRIHITASTGRILSVRYDGISKDVEIRLDLCGSAVPSRILCEWVTDFGSESESHCSGEVVLSHNGICTFSRQNSFGKEGILSVRMGKE
ncbi:MAG: hypothetical protein J5859_04345 [Clostridia bacterium]|nr:hypothetical protein [Clostridia bacterium]